MADDNAFANALLAALQRQIAALSAQLAQAEATNAVLAVEIATLRKGAAQETHGPAEE